MKKLKIVPLKGPISANVCIPGSKSYTNRVLAMAALTVGTVTIKNPLFSDDTEAMIGVLKTLGFKVETFPDKIVVHQHVVEDKNYLLFARDSGTTVRFALALLCTVKGVKTIQGSKRLNERPIKDLVDALRELGAKIEYFEHEGRLPVKITTSFLSGNVVDLKGDVSSQFCSALLLIAPAMPKGLTIHIQGELISKPYVGMTLSCMRDWGVEVEEKKNCYYVAPNQRYQMKETVVEGDYSSAGYFFAIAALTRSTIILENLNPDSAQADRNFLRILEKMGNSFSFEKNRIRIVGKQVLPMDIDMEDCPDQVMTLAVLAAFAKGTTKISGVRSLRVKETERVVAIKNELAKMGIQTEDTHDTLIIHGGSPHGAEIETYNDHRIAMAFAVAGMVIDGIIICHPEVVNKTFPTFWEILESLR